MTACNLVGYAFLTQPRFVCAVVFIQARLRAVAHLHVDSRLASASVDARCCGE